MILDAESASEPGKSRKGEEGRGVSVMPRASEDPGSGVQDSPWGMVKKRWRESGQR